MPGKTKPTIPTLSRLVKGIKTPEGFERSVHTEPKTEWCAAYKVLTLKGDGIEIVVEFNGFDKSWDSWSLASGHVSFSTSQGTRTFDRYGVEDSFYIDNPLKWGTTDDVVEKANEQILAFIETKIPEARARVDRSERIPGIPFDVTPETKARVTEQLKAGTPYRFMPSGFGTGYVLSTKRTRYSKRAERATEKFLSVTPVYVETFDAD